MEFNRKSGIILFLAVYLCLGTILLFLSTENNQASRAIALMAIGLILLWVGIGGVIMYRVRLFFLEIFKKLPLGWRTKFVLLATFLALIEEAVATSMTNLAPLFGVRVGEAYITASTNYLDVVVFHSVIVFVPMFLGWAWLLGRYAFSPFAVFLSFGFTGLLAEVLSGGPQHFLLFAQWIFIYGLMVYLPAFCVPDKRGAVPPRWYHYPLAVAFPLLWTLLTVWIPFALGHPHLHY